MVVCRRRRVSDQLFLQSGFMVELCWLCVLMISFASMTGLTADLFEGLMSMLK